MNKKIIFFILITVASVFLFLAINIFTKKGPSSPPPFYPTPTPIPLITPVITKTALTIMATTPKDKAINIPVDQSITILFNRLLSAKEIIFEISPFVPFTQKLQNNTLIISPKKLFTPGTLYTYIVKYPLSGQLPKTHSFTTIGPTQTTLPNTAPTGFLREEEDFQLKTHPDVFLANKTPFETNNFSITSDYTPIPQGHFFFIVQLKGGNKEQSKNIFLSWLSSLGLSNTQIGNLDLRYE